VPQCVGVGVPLVFTRVFMVSPPDEDFSRAPFSYERSTDMTHAIYGSTAYRIRSQTGGAISLMVSSHLLIPVPIS